MKQVSSQQSRKSVLLPPVDAAPGDLVRDEPQEEQESHRVRGHQHVEHQVPAE